jgi:hypothetical protein
MAQGCASLLKNLEATSKFWAPEGWYEAISVLKTHKILGANAQNLVSVTTWLQEFVYATYKYT